jgi:hypothetical protein
VAVPANPTITTTSGGNTTNGPQAMMGIGPSGLLVEDNGTLGQSSAPYYENALGAGTGAIGLPKPSSAVNTNASDTNSLVNAQYLGFFYGSGSSPSTTNWSSSVASFGFPNLSTSCQTLMTQISPQISTPLANPIYGGDFKNNDPSTSTDGYGRCDFAIDLGAQDPSTNGLFPRATVYVGPTFAGNTTRTTINSFHAVAIAGQLNGKYAIFLIGEDTVGSPKQAWGIYLLQSN